jgi:solute carrier family 25 carnitine/acylcarnitine transporter 20/29
MSARGTETDDRGVLQRLTDTENLFVGIAAGVLNQLCVQPILYWKHAVQQRMAFTLDPRLLYRGTAVACANMAALTGLQFQLSGVMQKWIAGDTERPLGPVEQIAAGFIGGAMSGPVCCVLELTLIQQQRYSGSVFGTPARIASTFGASGLMRGLVPSTGREAVFTAGCLGIVPVAKRKLQDDMGMNSQFASFLGSAGAGLVCAALSHPLDTVKTCMQGDVERKKYGSLRATIGALSAEGAAEFGPGMARWRSFFRGYGWRSTNIIFDFLIINSLMETLAPIMYAERFGVTGPVSMPPSF